MTFRLFSTPLEGDFLTLAEHLSCRLFRGVLDGVNAVAERRGLGRLAVDPAALGPDRLSTRMWSPDVGHVLRGLSARDDGHAPWMSAQLAVLAFLRGLVDRLELDVDLTGRWLDAAGHSVGGERLRFDGERGRLRARGSGGELRLLLERIEEDGDEVWKRPGGDELVRVGSAGSAVVTDGRYMAAWDPPAYATALGAPRLRERIEEAATLLEECQPATYVWIAAVLREVTALASPESGTKSASSVSWPGHVFMSAPASLIQTITMLVHECCHQYFYLVQSCARVTRAGAPEPFSILKQTRRPLDRVLLGFHAFGNVLLVQEALADGGHPVDRAEIEEQRVFTRQLVAGLDGALRDTWEEHLAEAGVELYLPLRQRLVAAGLLDSAARPAA
jgi:HEXXH motif-containing protein